METKDKQIVSFKQDITSAAIENVLKKFPTKILELNELLSHKTFQFQFNSRDEPNIPVPDITANIKSIKSDVNNIEESDPINSEVFMVSSNRYLVEMVDRLQPLILEFTENTLLLTVAINLMRPTIEDGNNFGVEIQWECYDQIITAENDMQSRINEIQKYFISRSELVAKAMKNPYCEDYRAAIRERDKVFHRFLVVSATHLRNYYLRLHDLIIKNLNKITKPKTQVSNALLY